MASAMLKYLKFAHLLNRQLSLRHVKYYPKLSLYRSHTKFSKSYATAAYKVALNEDSNIRNKDALSNIDGKNIQSIDSALARIDSLIRRNGRMQMKHIFKIFSSITNKEMTSSLHGLYLLRGCKYCIDEPPSKRINMVNEIWNRYQELGIEFDVRHYNAMLDVHIKNRLNFNPVDILTSMEDLTIQPNKDTYMLLMKKYCQDGNINGASEILEYMKEKQLTADEKVFNYLIEAHINNNDIAGAKEMVEVMRSSNLEPTADTHAVLACGYAASGNKEEMMSHLRECKDVDNIENYLKVIDILATSGNQQYIDDVLSLIEHKEWHKSELINAAVELIHKNCIETAYKLVTLSCTPNYIEGANIFVKQLIKVGRECEEVLKYCEKIQKEGLSENIYMVAIKASAEYGQTDHMVQLFKKIEEKGYCIRPSSFWTLFSAIKGDKPYEGCWSILKCMTELAVPCDIRTYTNAVYPTLGVPKPDEVLDGIKHSGQVLDTAADALFLYYCNIREVDFAFELIEKHPISVSNRFDVKNFVKLYEDLSIENIPKYHKLLKFIFMEDKESAAKCVVPGRLLAELIIHKRRLLEIILDKFEDLAFSEYTFYICEQELKERNPASMIKLKELHERINLKKTLTTEREILTKEENISVEDEDKYINHLQAENLSIRPFLVKRIDHHIRAKNIDRVEQLLATFDKLKLRYTPTMLSNLFGLWCLASDINKAKETLDKLKADFPDFQVLLPKALDYTSILIKYEKFDESYEALKDFMSKPHYYSNDAGLIRAINRFNATLANTGNDEFVKKMQNLILPLSKDLGSKKSLFDSSVNVHLQRNDLKAALEEFRNIILTHRVPACLNQFLKKCIQANDKDTLQTVVDLTIKSAGKSYALLELAVAFIEKLQIQNAAKVIENLGSETVPGILDNMCEKLCNQNKLNELEYLIHITQSLNHVDREKLYCRAFRACVNKNDFQRAIKLFEKMKKEVIEPRSETIKLFQDLLIRYNQPLPLSLISGSSSEISSSAVEATKTFLQLLEAGNLEDALKELSGLKKGYIRTLPIKTMSDLVDLCLQKNCCHELSSITHAMTYIFENGKDVLQPIIEKYSETGDTEKFILLMSFIPDFSLMSINFNHCFCRAFLASGKYDSLLSMLEERVNQKHKLFSPIAFEELLKHPEYEERIFNLAVKYLENNYNTPITVVWAHYFIKGNYEKASEIYKKYPTTPGKVDNMIFRKIKQNENVDLAKKYIEFLKDSSVHSRVKEKAYGTAVDLLVFKGMYDEAADLVVESEKENLQLHRYFLSTLVTLKSLLEKENKPVPFSLPLDHTSASESRSESD